MTVTTKTSRATASLTDTVIVAVSRLVDDAQSERRDPSHSDIEFEIQQAGLQQGDPKTQGQSVGKAKRVRSTLSWALEHAPDRGEALVAKLVSHIRACGGFRPESPNYVGPDVVENAQTAFKTDGYDLSLDGELRPVILDNLSGAMMTDALLEYVRRARRGIEDAALVTGTGKDLLEATAKHVLIEQYGTCSTRDFPTLLGQAFDAVGLATPVHRAEQGEAAQKRFERALYEMGCAINHLRNKEGTGHGRPWLPSVTDAEARIAVEIMGAIAKRLLDGLQKIK